MPPHGVACTALLGLGQMAQHAAPLMGLQILPVVFVRMILLLVFSLLLLLPSCQLFAICMVVECVPHNGCARPQLDCKVQVVS